MRKLRRALLLFAHGLTDPGPIKVEARSCTCGWDKWFPGCTIHRTRYAYLIDRDVSL